MTKPPSKHKRTVVLSLAPEVWALLDMSCKDDIAEEKKRAA